MRRLIIPIAALLGVTTRAYGQNLTDAQIDAVTQDLATGATHPWELGTRAQTLMEMNASSLSVLTHGNTLPPPTTLDSSLNSSLVNVFSIAQSVVSQRAESNLNATGPQPLVSDDAAGDPPSIGVAVLLANWTGLGEQDGNDYAGAATDQLDYLFNVVPKTSDGAISHRRAQVQLWSDFVYMVPPFIAYYGITTNNQSMISEAYNQIKLYRNYLNDDSAGGLWKHILLGEDGDDTANDEGHWSTGNGWAAMGMLRVLGTMQSSPWSGSFKNEMQDLRDWVLDIQTAMYNNIQSNNLFLNYADDTNSSSNFDDAASTALIAASVYRLSLLTDTHTHLPQAEACRSALFAISTSSSSSSSSSTASASSSSSTATTFSSMAHFTSSGWITPVVNPDAYGSEGSQSPESEAFVLQLHQAWSDWVAAGSVGANGARGFVRRAVAGMGVSLGAALIVGGWLVL